MARACASPMQQPGSRASATWTKSSGSGVVEGGTLLGVISFHDVARAVLEEQGFESLILRNFVRNWPDEVLPVGKPSANCSER